MNRTRSAKTISGSAALTCGEKYGVAPVRQVLWMDDSCRVVLNSGAFKFVDARACHGSMSVARHVVLNQRDETYAGRDYDHRR